ncbi:DUF6279 family lipoprotein [Shewanella sp. Isolate13]|uniref:DUF6279 family lipoprotein n=1 Tax=Shewanella sp. Isolate13 TaxID=2908531 RepID=UPI001EFCBAD7|nr:DUF6279 family lipoprotein [Shewanella sp. Isolate13]MCG9729405.1 DUF6279 family lipoprotein [Shewanella sp. Isolate13]
MRTISLYALLLVTLLGCSTKMGYYFLDWLIEWKLEEYVTLNNQQQKQFQHDLDQFLTWHRTEELPRYEKQLLQLALAFEKQTLTPQLWAQHVEQAKSHWARTLEFVTPSLVALMSSFSDKQVQQVIAQLRVDEKRLNQKYLGKDHQALVEMADERIEKRVKRWIGKLTQEQKQAIHQYNLSRATTLDMWLEYRHEWIRLFEQALKNRQNQLALSHSLTILMSQPDRLKSAAYKTALDANTQDFGQLLITLNLLASSQQKRRFQKKLASLITDLSELSGSRIQSARNPVGEFSPFAVRGIAMKDSRN